MEGGIFAPQGDCSAIDEFPFDVNLFFDGTAREESDSTVTSWEQNGPVMEESDAWASRLHPSMISSASAKYPRAHGQGLQMHPSIGDGSVLKGCSSLKSERKRKVQTMSVKRAQACSPSYTSTATGAVQESRVKRFKEMSSCGSASIDMINKAKSDCTTNGPRSEADENESGSEADENESGSEADENESRSEADENESRSEADENKSRSEADENKSRSEADENESRSEADENESRSDADKNESESEADENESESEADENESGSGADENESGSEADENKSGSSDSSSSDSEADEDQSDSRESSGSESEENSWSQDGSEHEFRSPVMCSSKTITSKNTNKKIPAKAMRPGVKTQKRWGEEGISCFCTVFTRSIFS